MVINNKRRLLTLAAYLAQAVVVLSTIYVALGLKSYDLTVPFNYSGDSVVALMFVKALILNVWTWNIPQLSAPFEMNAAAFPLMTSFDWLIMKGIVQFTDKPGLVLNTFWMLTIVLSAWTTAISLEFLGANRISALVAGILYAFLPYALLRNVAHINLVYYLVPFLALLAIHIAVGGRVLNKYWQRLLVYFACFAQGFNYIYYSFFSVALFSFAAIYAYAVFRSRASVKTAVVAVSLLVLATAANLAPSIYAWSEYGKPPEMGYKYTAEAEIFGAKIRKMLAPHSDNPVPLLSKWGRRDAHASFPSENENVTARFGLYGAAGFLLLLLVSLGLVRAEETTSDRAATMNAMASLSLFTLLVITVGGFGAIFNVATVPDIRAYNRFSVFIAFFSVAALALMISEYGSRSGRVTWKAILAVGLFAAFSLYDQLLDRKGLVSTQESDIAAFKAERELLGRFSMTFEGEISALQFPMTGFPPLSMHEDMASYDHLRPFLFAGGDKRWSWPSFSQRHRGWQERISGLEGSALLKAAVYSGFGAIWIDRYGYRDRAASLVAGLQDAGAVPVLSSERYSILDLRGAAATIKAAESPDDYARHVDEWMNGIVTTYARGFYSEETNPHGVRFRWSGSESEIEFRNYSAFKRRVTFAFDLGSATEGHVVASVAGASEELSSASVPVHHQLTFDVEANSVMKVNLSSRASRVEAPNDPRKLYFYVANPTLKSDPATN